MKFSTRLFLGAAGMVFVTAATSSVVANVWLRARLADDFAEQLEREARLIAAAIASQPESLNAVARQYGTIVGRRVTFIGTDGQVLGDSDFELASLELLENHLDRPEVRAAMSRGTGVDRRVSASTNRAELKVAVSAWPGIVRVSAPIVQLQDFTATVLRGILFSALLAVAVGLAIALLAGRAVARPLHMLTESARTAAAGGQPEFPQSSVTEIRDLAWAFRSMHEDQAERLADLVRQRHETEALIESMAEGVLAADERGRILICNSAMRDLLGFGEVARVPNLMQLFHAREARKVVETVTTGHVVSGREVDLGDRTVLMTGRPLADGGAVLSMLDISDLRRLQLVRRDFVANVSHELKTPLTSMLGYAETLMTEEPDATTRRNFLRVITDNAKRMQFLVDDLLDLARIESGSWAPTPEPIDVERVAREVWEVVSDRRGQADLEFTVDVGSDVRLVADREAFRQILTNLLDNAQRHTAAGGQITVAAATDPAGIRVEVRDTGSGIPSEHVDRVFERFYRVDPGRSRQEGGTGLGLAIVKHLCEYQGAQISLDSVLGRGTSVHMVFPAESPDETGLTTR